MTAQLCALPYLGIFEQICSVKVVKIKMLCYNMKIQFPKSF